MGERMLKADYHGAIFTGTLPSQTLAKKSRSQQQQLAARLWHPLLTLLSVLVPFQSFVVALLRTWANAAS